MFVDFPAKNTVYTPCIFMVLSNPMYFGREELDGVIVE